MAIIKLEKVDTPYEQIHRETIQAIKDPIALAIWVYLLSKPKNWVVREKEIRNHFSRGGRKLGATSYLKAMKELRELGLYEVIRDRDENNRFTCSRMIVFPQLRISTTTDFHNYGKPYDINNTDNTIDRDINNTDTRKEEKEEGYVLKSTKGMYSKVQRVCTQKYNNSNINNRDINIKEEKENKKKSKFQTLLDQLPKQLLTEKAKEYLEDFYKYRTEIKKPIKTYRPLLAYLNTLIALKNKNINLEEAIRVMKDREWQTLKEDWLKNTGLESWSA